MYHVSSCSIHTYTRWMHENMLHIYLLQVGVGHDEAGCCVWVVVMVQLHHRRMHGGGGAASAGRRGDEGRRRGGGLLLRVLLLVSRAEASAETLTLAGLVVLEPVEDILALDAAIVGEVRRDLLDLRRVGRPHAAAVHLLQDHQLLRRRAPTGRRRLRHYYIIVGY
jgi:hypothetical protein